MSKTFVVMLLAGVEAFGQAQDVVRLSGAPLYARFSASSRTGSRQLDISATIVDPVTINGKTQNAKSALFVVFDPQTNLCWWDLYKDRSSEDLRSEVADMLRTWTFAIDVSSIIGFRKAGGALLIRSMKERYSRREMATAGATKELQQNFRSVFSGDIYKRVELYPALGSGFLDHRPWKHIEIEIQAVVPTDSGGWMLDVKSTGQLLDFTEKSPTGFKENNARASVFLTPGLDLIAPNPPKR